MLFYTKVSQNKAITLCMTQESNIPEEGEVAKQIRENEGWEERTPEKWKTGEGDHTKVVKGPRRNTLKKNF